jgi:hypothetical protein
MLGALEFLIGSEREEDARLLLPAFALLGYVRQRWGKAALAALEPGTTALEILGSHDLGAAREARLAAWIDIAALDGWIETAPPPGCQEARRFLEKNTGSETAARILGYDRDSDTLDDDSLTQFLTWRATTAALAWLATAAGSRQDSADAIVGWCDVLERLRRTIKDENLQLGPVLSSL